MSNYVCFVFGQVLVTMKDGRDSYSVVLVEDMGVVSTTTPNSHTGDHQVIVFVSQAMHFNSLTRSRNSSRTQKNSVQIPDVPI